MSANRATETDVLGRDSIDARAENATKNRDRAVEVDDRWTWYVLTIPLVAFAIALHMEKPQVPIGVWLHIIGLLLLVVAGVSGIIYQRNKAEMLFASAATDIRLAQISMEQESGTMKRLLDELDNDMSKRKIALDGMSGSQSLHFCTTGLGLFFLFMQHTSSLF